MALEQGEPEEGNAEQQNRQTAIRNRTAVVDQLILGGHIARRRSPEIHHLNSEIIGSRRRGPVRDSGRGTKLAGEERLDPTGNCRIALILQRPEGILQLAGQGVAIDRTVIASELAGCELRVESGTFYWAAGKFKFFFCVFNNYEINVFIFSGVFL